MNSKEKFVDRRYAKVAHYKRAMEEIIGENVCPLCPKHMKWHTNPILKRRNGWFITKSFAPYKNTKHHFVIISKEHKEDIEELTARDWSAITSLVRFAKKEFKIKGGGLMLRFGDTKYTGATVHHLHAHFVVPKIVKGKAKPVYFPIG